MWNYFFQYIFTGLATVFTGLVAWLVFSYSKRDKKIEAATILMTEISVAEREINIIKRDGIVSDYSSILPSNHWDDFQHLFVRDFNSDEMTKISDFFKSCTLAEESIKLIKSYLVITMEQKTRSIQEKLLELADEASNKDEYEKRKKAILELFHDEQYWFLPNAPKEKLLSYLNNVDQLSLTTIGGKFNSVKTASWYKFLI